MGQTRSTLRQVWSVVGLNIGWFACVLAATWNLHWLSVLIVSALGAIHLAVVGRAGVPCASLLMAASLVFGLVLDTTLIMLGTFEPNRWLMPYPATTIWLLMLWVNFSLVLNESLQFLQRHLLIAAVMGALFGPLAYLAASRLEAIHIMNPVNRKLLLICIAWAVAMPLISLTARSLYDRPYRFRKR
jgi:hypothetical protein